MKDQLELFILKPSQEIPNLLFDSLIEKLCNLKPIRYVTEKVTGAVSFLIKGNEFYIPLGDKIDKEAETEKLKLELDYARGFLKSVMVKLSNERFVANAKPEVVEVERRKMADAELKIKTIEEQISMLKK
jgi:valyl-tRNA synthetase